MRILGRLKFDNDTTDRVCRLVHWHDADNPELSGKAVRRAVHRIGVEQYPALFAVKRADILAQSGYRRAEKLAYVDAYEQMYRECMEKKECLTIRELAVSGQDLIAAGRSAGKADQEMLNELLDRMEDPGLNTKEQLLKIVTGKISDQNRS